MWPYLLRKINQPLRDNSRSSVLRGNLLSIVGYIFSCRFFPVLHLYVVCAGVCRQIYPPQGTDIDDGRQAETFQ